MKKNFLSTVAGACLLSGAVCAADITAEGLQNSLYEKFSDKYESVIVVDSGSSLNLKLPENEVITFATDELGLP